MVHLIRTCRIAGLFAASFWSVAPASADTITLSPFPIPVGAACQSVDDRPTVASGGLRRQYRIRSGAAIELDGNRTVTIFDRDGAGTVRGNDNVLYVGTGANVTVTGERNQIFMTPGARVYSYGGNTLVPVPGFELVFNERAEACR